MLHERKAVDPPLLDLSIPSDFHSVRKALQQTVETLEDLRLPVDLIASAQIVLAEALNNVVEHAYRDTAGTIRLCIFQTEGGVLCQIEDLGYPMPGGKMPEGLTVPDLSVPDLPEGGFGWYLSHTLSRELAYTRCGDRNLLSILLSAEQSPPKATTVAKNGKVPR